MSKKNPSALLQQRIRDLEAELAFQETELKVKLNKTVESLRPTALLKSLFNDMSSSSDIKSKLSHHMVGYISGIIAKKIFSKNKQNPLATMEGKLIELLVSAAVAGNFDELKAALGYIVSKVKDMFSEKTTATE